jgi:hypothetical protein
MVNGLSLIQSETLYTKGAINVLPTSNKAAVIHNTPLLQIDSTKVLLSIPRRPPNATAHPLNASMAST